MSRIQLNINQDISMVMIMLPLLFYNLAVSINAMNIFDKTIMNIILII